MSVLGLLTVLGALAPLRIVCGQPLAQVYPAGPEHFIPDGTPFVVPSVALRDIFVDPLKGSDARTGDSAAQALRTLSSAWQRVPRGRLTQGVRIVLLPGELDEDAVPQYWEDRWGSPSAPLVITSVSGDPRSVTVARINMFNCSSVYLLGFTIASGNDPFHCERCYFLHLRDMRVLGQSGSADSWESIKLNQCQAVFIEDSEVAGADDNAIDMVAVQYGHVIGCDLHDGNWCVYLKGGSAYFLVARNAIHGCGESGFAAGQGTGLQYMVAPWDQYEAYDIRVVNNLIYDVWGAGLGVFGGLNILMAHNTLTRVGSRSHAVEFNLGSRVCDRDDTAARCAVLRSRGAWGPASPAENGEWGVPIPNKNVHFLNNLVYNPPGETTKWQHLTIEQPSAARGGVPGALVRADEGLLVAGNLFWNGGGGMPLGVSDPEDAGCPQAGALAPGEAPPPGCWVAQLLRDNEWSPPGAAPPFVDYPRLDLRPLLGGPTAAPTAAAVGQVASALLVSPLPSFPPWPLSTAPPGEAAAPAVPTDIMGRSRRLGNDFPGAYTPYSAAPGPGSSPAPAGAAPSGVPSPAPSAGPGGAPSPGGGQGWPGRRPQRTPKKARKPQRVRRPTRQG